jgi:hypothetical protein
VTKPDATVMLADVKRYYCAVHTNELLELMKLSARANPLALTITVKRHKPSKRKPCNTCSTPSLLTLVVKHTGWTS